MKKSYREMLMPGSRITENLFKDLLKEFEPMYLAGELSLQAWTEYAESGKWTFLRFGDYLFRVLIDGPFWNIYVVSVPRSKELPMVKSI